MIKKTLQVVVIMCLLIAPGIADAAKGTVVLTKSGCDYYIVETFSGYAILQWYGGSYPSQGDILGGDFDSYGMKTLYNVSSGSETKVWVDSYWMPRSTAIEKYYEKCCR